MNQKQKETFRFPKKSAKNNFPAFPFRKTFFVALAVFLLSLSPVKAKNSEAWLSFAAAQYKQLLEEISETIKSIQVAIAKQAAMQALYEQINSLIVGDSSQSVMFITNWEDYLIKAPEEKAARYLNDYLSQTTYGRGSASSYTASYEGFDSSGSGNHYQNLLTAAKTATFERPQPKITYEGDPSNMFSEGNFRNLGIFLSGINNELAFSLNAQSEYQKKIEEEKKIASDKAIAYEGFTGTSAGEGMEDIVITPGSVTKDSLVNIQNIGNNIIANANNLPEIMVASVSQLLIQSLQQGIGEVKRVVYREVSNIENRLSSSLNAQIDLTGPGTIYRNINQPLSQYPTPSSQNPCQGKGYGDSCLLPTPQNGSLLGECAENRCWPIKR